MKGEPNLGAMKLRPVPLLEGAACRRHPNPDLWFSVSPGDRATARAICRSCPELEPCRAWALAQPVCGQTGIVAGMSAAERKAGRIAERREQKQAASRPPKPRSRTSRAEVRAGVLALVRKQPGLSQNAIGRQLGCDWGTARAALDGLAADGLITITAGPRGALLHYPAAGNRELDELRQRSPMAARNKAKTHCGICGSPLAGANLMVVRDRDGGRERRVCRVCHRRRGTSSRRLARMLARARRTAAA